MSTAPIDAQHALVCPGCASADGAPVLHFGDSHIGDGQRLLRCRNCGLVYAWPAVPPDQGPDLYPPAYYAHQPVARTPGRWPVLRSLVLHCYYGYALPDRLAALSPAWPLRVAGRLLAPLQTYWRTIPPAVAAGRLLDVGCGSGAYLARVRALGWSVCGVEPDAAACAYARTDLGIDVVCGNLEDSHLPERSFDVVTFWHTLEHTTRPLPTLQQAYALLRPGGLIMLEVPNWESTQRCIFGLRWFHLDAPRHRVHFTAHVLRHYLTLAGFANVCITSVASSVGVTGSLEGIGHERRDSSTRRWRHNRALKAAAWLPEALLSRVGLGGCLMATARKP
jgi:SAM-dependent methyltransferase